MDLEAQILAAPVLAGRESLLDAALSAAPAGLALEFGVANGYSLTLIAKHPTRRAVFGFDSFEGLPEDWVMGPGKVAPKGWFSIAHPEHFAWPANVTIVQGWFEDSLPRFLVEQSEPIAFVHIDCDLYSSARTALNLLAKSLAPGVVLVFDELIEFDPGPGRYEFWREGEWRALLESGIRVEPIARTNKQQVALRVI
jgi:hypothetical protein